MESINISDLTLKQLRMLKGITIREMGKKMGISFQTYQHKESGNVKFYNNEINKLCEIFNLDISIISKIIRNGVKKKKND